ncbi:DUF4215 domain-containing protein [Myxococcota bacterium]
MILGFSLVWMGCESYPSVVVRKPNDTASGGNTSSTKEATPKSNVELEVTEETSEEPEDRDIEAECGNGELEPGELCDDGNTEDDDGCAEDCQTQDPDYVCLTPGEECVRAALCGNGILEGKEICDDSNTQDGDGCAENCRTVEDGWLCPRPGRLCVELPACGNGILERGETCDDGNEVSGDGCSGLDEADLTACQVEEGFWCSAPNQDCVPLKCGDGDRTPEEQCDDGNTEADDGCSRTCEVEEGWRCSLSGCRSVCGDGLLVAAEECDDGNHAGGDGCSGACQVEPFWSCAKEPSVCTSTIVCGNSVVEPGEICDPPGKDGCLQECASFAPDVGEPPACGNSRIEPGETCDPPAVGAGCGADCRTEPGFVCPRSGMCFQTPVCGDGIVQADEQCDIGAQTSTGCVDCQITGGWLCYGVQPSTCEQPLCGDGVRSLGEECDDDNASSEDGCDSSCEVEDGWVCPEAGTPCIPACGDGVIVGDETCDDRNRTNGDGCNVACRVEPGFTCPETGKPCLPAECGNGEPESGEGCDDGNLIAGDGCGPTCQLEPIVTLGPTPTVDVTCGDGLVTGGEACDDGNTSSGDGCSETCRVEDGYSCEDRVAYPPFVEFAVTYRDFKGRAEVGGHPDFEWRNNPFRRDIPGPVCTTTNNTPCSAAPGEVCPAGTCARLDAEGKPVFHLTGEDTERGASERGRVTNADTFALWYRDTNAAETMGEEGVIDMWQGQDSLRLAQLDGAAPDVYRFDSSRHFPLGDLGVSSTSQTDPDDPLGPVDPPGSTAVTAPMVPERGFGLSPNQNRNYHFTTELRYFFQYRGGETLTFRGDDDVWVYINGHLAVDIGGVHDVRYGRVVLGDDGDDDDRDSNCSAHGLTTEPPSCALEPAEVSGDDDRRFGLVRGGVYEIVLFHAERHTTASNFQLTLAGFLAPRSHCGPICGDGKIVGWELCDDGAENADDIYGRCDTTCTRRALCGDGVRQGPNDSPSGPEQCDNGRNLDTYSTNTDDECAPGCLFPPRCGDGLIRAGFEECDNGADNHDAAYGLSACKTDCTLAGSCGDGVVDEQEICDRGPKNGQEYGPDSCGYDCQPGPRCGDATRNGPEECDGTKDCRPNCTLQPFCGDGIVSAGEQCDYGQFASNTYGGCTEKCQLGPWCGDGHRDKPYEECDLGTELNLGDYDGCTSVCALGPHCGDGVRQAKAGEECDNGFNDDTYAYSTNACGRQCTLPPHCGDGNVDPDFELCDDGEDNSDAAYNGCTTQCTWGPYCGDGQVDADEACDDGTENTLYSHSGEGCGPDCQPVPYCGDGERNGPEECDDGSDDNTGDYGACKPDCTLAPRCGDGKVQASEGEECDEGPIGSLTCTPDCRARGEIR